MTHQKLYFVVALCIVTVLSLKGVAYAEDKWVSNVYGTTNHIQGGYNAYTYSTSQAPYIEVNIKSWGSCCPRYKGGDIKSKYNAYNSGTALISDIYFSNTSRHLANTQYGGIEFYTSDNGTHSSYCWWINGTASC